MATDIEDSLARLCDRQHDKIKELSALNSALLHALRGLMVDAPRQNTKYPMPARYTEAYMLLDKAEGR